MKITPLVTLAISLLCLGAAEAQTYTPFTAPDMFVTGIRSNSTTTDDVVITGSYGSNTYCSPPAAVLYVGSLQAVASSPTTSWKCFQPHFPNQPAVTSSTFYGPNTFIFDSSLGAGNVRAVGTYLNTGSRLHGMMYVGPDTGCPHAFTCWTPLDATPLLHGDQKLENTVPHSTMGNLIVGNWNLVDKIGHAFIYDISAGTWLNINPTNSLSVTAYGIWQNSDGTYTIAGGYSNLRAGGIDGGYIVDYDPSNQLQPFSHLAQYSFNNQPSVISHFDGITVNPSGGYNLTGVYIVPANGKTLGFFVTVSRTSNGSFVPNPTWTSINFSYPGITNVKFTTGDTVIDNYVLGVFDGMISGTQQTRSYIASVP